MEPIAFILNKKEDYTKRGSARWLPLNGWLSLSSYPVLTKCFSYCLNDSENETSDSLFDCMCRASVVCFSQMHQVDILCVFMIACIVSY